MIIIVASIFSAKVYSSLFKIIPLFQSEDMLSMDEDSIQALGYL